MQGAGGVFALVGAAYIATTNFPASRAATLIGATQMFGMAGGSAGQFLVGPAIASGVPWSTFWIGMGIVGSRHQRASSSFSSRNRSTKPRRDDWLKSAASAMRAVFLNPQSILCGMIAGLLFIPTTIFDMVWGVRYLQEARGLDYGSAVMRSSMVPLGWIIGCPLLGFLSDRIGTAQAGDRRRRGRAARVSRMDPVRPRGSLPAVCPRSHRGPRVGRGDAALHGHQGSQPAGMSGTATGVVNFLNFTFSALLGPVFGWLLVTASGGATQMTLDHYQMAFQPLLYGVALAIVLTLLLKETGPAARTARAVPLAQREAT